MDEEVTIDASPRIYQAIPARAVNVDGHESVELSTPRTADSIAGVLDSVSTDDALEYPYIVAVTADVILNRGFADEVASAILDPGLEGTRWIALASDGVDRTGRRVDTGNYLDDPATPSAASLRVAAWADPAIAVINRAGFAELAATSGSIASFSDVLDAGATQGLAVFLTPRLRYSSLSERWSTDTADVRGRIPERAAISLETIRPDPTVTVVIRTLLDRPALLERSLKALSAEHDRSPILEALVVSTADTSQFSVPSDPKDSGVVPLPVVVIQANDPTVPSRSAAMLTGLHEAKGDYVWFVDDDDWVAQGSIRSIKDAVHAMDRPVLIGASEVIEEGWNAGILTRAESVRRYLPDEWHRAFTGWNFLPNCSLVIPRDSALRRIAASSITSDLGEDYALQLLLLTAPGSMVTVVDETIAYISRRDGDDNAVTMTDRTPWLRDLGSHISDLSRDASASTAAFWRLGSEVRRIPYPEEAISRHGGTDGSTEPDQSGTFLSVLYRRTGSIVDSLRRFMRKFQT